MKYLEENGEPLTHCPACGASLQRDDGGIELTLHIGGRDVVVYSRLNEDGRLEDTDGHHSRTACGSCRGDLLTFEEANEE